MSNLNDGSSAGVREFLRQHRQAITSGAVTVLILAIVIVALAAFSPLGEESSRRAPSTYLGNDDVVVQAESALVSGETTRAVALAQTVLKADPGNTRALIVVRKATVIRNQQSAGGTTSTGSAKTGTAGSRGGTTEDKRFSAAIKDIGSLLPLEFEGYNMGYVASLSGNADVSAVPQTEGMPAFRIAWGVRNTGSVKAARNYLKNTTKELYPKSADGGLTIDGAPAYFGTDGTDLASIAYSRGWYVFEVVVAADKTGDPAKLRTLAIQAAKAFADEPPK